MRELYGWWQFDDRECVLSRKTDGANLRFMLEAERPDPLTRVFVFRLDLPTFAPAYVPVEGIDRQHANRGLLTWRINLASAQFEDGIALLGNAEALAIEWFLMDAFSAWPEQTAAGVKPGLIELCGGRVNGRVVEDRWRQFHSCLSSDERPRWSADGLPSSADIPWELIRPFDSEHLPDVPDFRTLSANDIHAWLDERCRNAPRLASGKRTLFPLWREWNDALRWVFCDEYRVFDRLVSHYALRPSAELCWSCPDESVIGTRHATDLRLFDFPGEFGRPRQRDLADHGWKETPHLPAALSQQIAEAISQASYALGDIDLSLVDRRSSERVTFHITTPHTISHWFGFTGGILKHGINEGIAEKPTPFVSLDERVDDSRSQPPRLRWDEARALIADRGSSRTLSFERTLVGSPLAETEQWFVLTYRDDASEWPLFVHRQPRQDGFRPKPWLVDARPAPGMALPDEPIFAGIFDFIAVALNGWPDDERTGPAPVSTRIFGGHLNGNWCEGYVTEVSGPDPTCRPLDKRWIDSALALPLTRWSRSKGGLLGNPPESPQLGAERPADFIEEWLAHNDHGVVLRSEDGSAILAQVGQITTHGHGGDTTSYWDYSDRDIWLRLTSSSKHGWNARAGGSLEGADPTRFEELVFSDPPFGRLFLRPQLVLQLRRARLALVGPGSVTLDWLPIDGAVIPGKATHLVEQTPQPRIFFDRS